MTFLFNLRERYERYKDMCISKARTYIEVDKSLYKEYKVS